MPFIYAIPALSLALVAWAVASRGFSSGFRRASMVAAIVLACGTLTLIRTNGITGDADSDLEWRWTETPEQRLLAQGGDEPLDSAAVRPVAPPPLQPPRRLRKDPIGRAPSPPAPRRVRSSRRASEKPVPEDGREPAPLHADSTGSDTKAVWPGFRGPERDSVDSRCADRHRLVALAARRIVAPPDRTGLVVLRRRRRSPVHAGAAR